MNLHQPFTVPPPAARADLTMKDGAVIRLRRYGKPGATRIVLGHGNGLAINAYAPFWLPLAEHYDLVAFDMRNHGENPLHTQEGHIWENFFSDIEEVFQGITRAFRSGAHGRCDAFAVVDGDARNMQRTAQSRTLGRGLRVRSADVAAEAGHPLIATQAAGFRKDVVARGAPAGDLRHAGRTRRAISTAPAFAPLAAGAGRSAGAAYAPPDAGRPLDAVLSARVRGLRVFGSKKDPTLFDRMARDRRAAADHRRRSGFALC